MRVLLYRLAPLYHRKERNVDVDNSDRVPHGFVSGDADVGRKTSLTSPLHAPGSP
jgi:hypothetical protein